LSGLILISKAATNLGSSASLMKLACLFERINGALFVHRKMIVLWETSHSFEKRKAYSSWEKSVKKCLLVHHHFEGPEAGVHVPAGTIKHSMYSS